MTSLIPRRNDFTCTISCKNVATVDVKKGLNFPHTHFRAIDSLYDKSNQPISNFAFYRVKTYTVWFTRPTLLLQCEVLSDYLGVRLPTVPIQTGFHSSSSTQRNEAIAQTETAVA